MFRTPIDHGELMTNLLIFPIGNRQKHVFVKDFWVIFAARLTNRRLLNDSNY